MVIEVTNPLKEILDASSIINTRAIPPGTAFITSPGVITELKDKWSHFRMVSLLESGKIKIIPPEDIYVQKVIAAVQEVGSKISDVDIELLALGLQFEDGILVTDDLEIQNVATFLNMQYRAATKHQISVQLQWIAICSGCKRQFSGLKHFDGMICDHCGSPLRKQARKIRKKSPSSRLREGKQQ
ncbi:MAG: NOB1 family endonuclease [Candidatus Hodarchaeota archaeon]